MIVLEQQTWVTLLGFAGFGLTLLTYLATMKRDLKAEITKVDSKIDDVRTDLKADIVGVRTDLKADIVNGHADLKADIGRLDGRLVALESRVHDIAMRLPATSTPAQPTTS